MANKRLKKDANLFTFSEKIQVLEDHFNTSMTRLSKGMKTFENAMLQEDKAKRAEFLDRIFHAQLGQMTTGLSPAAILIAYTDWWAHTVIAPNRCLQLMESAFDKMIDFYQNLIEYAANKNTNCFDTEDKRFHERFKDEGWHEWPYCAVANGFMLWEDWWQEASQIRGVAKDHRELISFFRYQWLNALSPENNPILNPVVLEKTLETSGKNLIDGWQNAQEDFWRHLKGDRPVGAEEFVVGKDIAVTQGKVVYRNDLIELIQYAPQTETVYPEPVLIIPAWIMKYYILDLSPHNSMVNYLVKQGHTVFMISWKNPDASYRNYGMQDYLKKGVLEAINATQSITGQKNIHATGYCIGGTLLSMAASYMARHYDDRLKTVTLFAAQTDFEEAGELMTFIDENQLSYLEDIMFSQGYLRGDQMSATFELLRPKELIWSKAVQRYLLGERPPLNDLMAWNSDTTRLPYKMQKEYLRNFHLNNDLAEGDYLIDGEPVALEDIKSPLFVVSTEKDHIAPWKSVYKIHLYANGSEITFVLANRGHNGGIVSEPGHKGRSYRIGKSAANAPYIAPEKWHHEHKSHKGSWWPKWHRWLAKHSGKKIAPPGIGAPEKGFQILEDAPGHYVLEK
ncbi:PHA/PHB synthase family protein [Legionella impletisoli]|uniref:Poly-beta-hydroxybutyrate polymerase n=1 Tax=Legionella impletisoli TaxID=343510 RepID=A0A917JXZ2_9GAMM|nr:alpha/beta fold hydrolase [Legionella impletisoli]GGI88226.1 poly-beta-hydroxybutyrate polymerase [Legionella impletisoli]